MAGVVGLDTASLRRAHLREQPEEDRERAEGRARAARRQRAEGRPVPRRLRQRLRAGRNGATGAGQTLALFELDGYAPADIAAYRVGLRAASVSLQNVLVDGATGAPGANADEVHAGHRAGAGAGPGLSKIFVYETPNDSRTATMLDCYSRIATDNLAKQVSTSWGGPENLTNSALLQSENTIFQQMAAQGQSVFTATGDNGAYDDGAALERGRPRLPALCDRRGRHDARPSAGGG